MRESERESEREKAKVRERERDEICVINGKYKEISWRVRKRRKRRKKVTSRSTEELVLKNNYILFNKST